MPELGHGHAGQLGLVADPRGQRRVGGEPLEGRELAVGEDAEQVDDGRAVLRVVEVSAPAGPARRPCGAAVTATLEVARAPLVLRERRAPTSLPARTQRHRCPKRRKSLTTFRELGVLPETCEALEAVGITDAFADPGDDPPASRSPATTSSARPRPAPARPSASASRCCSGSSRPHDDDAEFLAAPGKPQALVVVPTRELCIQVANDLRLAGARRGVRVLGDLRRPRLRAAGRGAADRASTSSSAPRAG